MCFLNGGLIADLARRGTFENPRAFASSDVFKSHLKNTSSFDCKDRWCVLKRALSGVVTGEDSHGTDGPLTQQYQSKVCSQLILYLDYFTLLIWIIIHQDYEINGIMCSKTYVHFFYTFIYFRFFKAGKCLLFFSLSVMHLKIVYIYLKNIFIYFYLHNSKILSNVV